MSKKEIAIILAGGRGKRMDILCYPRPKPVLPFAGKYRVIDFTSSNCIHSRIENILVMVDYQRALMTDYLSGWHTTNASTTLRLLPPKVGSYAGTADAVYQNLDYLEEHGAKTVLILAGDHVYKMDYRRMIAFHHQMHADVTVGVIRVPLEKTHRFGTVKVDAAARIKEFKEKSSVSQVNLASMGIYVFNKELLADRLREDAGETSSLHDFGYNILPRMVLTDQVFAYEFKGYWHDIGTVEAYYEAHMELLGPQPRLTLDSGWPILHKSSVPAVSTTDKGSNTVNSLISPGCTIEGRVENSVLSPGVHVAERAIVRNSVVMAGTSIGYQSIINGCIIDENVNIGKFCYVGFGTVLSFGNNEITVLGKNVTVPDCTAIGRSCHVRPGLGPDAFGTHLIPAGTILVNP